MPEKAGLWKASCFGFEDVSVCIQSGDKTRTSILYQPLLIFATPQLVGKLCRRSELGRRVYLVKYGVNGVGDNLRGHLKTDATDYKYAFYPSILEASHIREYINYVCYGFPQHWVRACGASLDVHRVLRLSQTQSLNQKPALLQTNLLHQKLGTRLWNTSRASHDIIWA
jgi:hypothetical protein